MKKWLRAFVVLALTAIFLLSAVYFRLPPDPLFEGRSASVWAKDLLSSDYTVRSEAEAALKRLGTAGVPQLVLLIEERNPPWRTSLERLSAFLPLPKIRPRDAALCQARGAEMLGALGPNALAAVPQLVELLEFDASAPEAERALLRVGRRSVPFLTKACESYRVQVRERAARLLREFAPLDADAAIALRKAINDRSHAVRRAAARSLASVDASAKSHAVTTLLPRTRDAQESVRAAAVESLGKLNDRSPAVMASLQAALQDKTPAVQLEAAKALWSLNHEPKQVVDVLTRILGTNERWQSAYALGEIGPGAASAVPPLIQVLQEEEVPRPFRTPPSASFALGKIGPAAIPHLSALLTNAQTRIRVSALLAFGFMGKGGHDAIPVVANMLKDRDSEVRHTAALTLAALGAEPEKMLAGLNDCLSAEDIYMRSAAAAVLRRIAPEQSWIVQPE